MLKHYQERAPLKRSCDPAELGQTGVFLASDGAAAITGQVIYVDGGYQVMGNVRDRRLIADLARLDQTSRRKGVLRTCCATKFFEHRRAKNPRISRRGIVYPRGRQRSRVRYVAAIQIPWRE